MKKVSLQRVEKVNSPKIIHKKFSPAFFKRRWGKGAKPLKGGTSYGGESSPAQRELLCTDSPIRRSVPHNISTFVHIDMCLLVFRQTEGNPFEKRFP